jgi:hypothetical protein
LERKDEYGSGRKRRKGGRTRIEKGRMRREK